MRLGRRQLTAIIIIVVIICIVAWFFIGLPRLGRTKIDVQAIPSNSVITLDGAKIKPGTIYVEPGSHTFAATADGYSHDTHVINITDKSITVGMLPEPTSDAALKWLNDNPDIQSRREDLGGINAEQEGLQSRAENPIMEKLPYIDPESLYAIDYGFTDDQPSHFYIVINNSSPEGRVNAIKWLKSQKVNISTTDIRYEDYQNPLLSQG